MAKYAVISDIHANLEALTAVLEDIDRQQVDDVVCLGDVVGYGPDPVACTERVRSRCSVTICGNHDEALIKGPWGFNQLARNSIEWTQKQMRPRFYRMGSAARWNFLATLPLTSEWNGYLLVHGSPRDPTSEYVLPQHASWPPPGMFDEIFERFSGVCFVGHTHLPGVFYEGPSFAPQHEIDGPFAAGSQKMLVNVGSVGQPRDGNWRACYLTIEDDPPPEPPGGDDPEGADAPPLRGPFFRYHRLEYAVDQTQAKIRSNPRLDDRLADRLGTGE